MAFPVHVVSFTRGDHICLFYRDLEDQVFTSAPYVEIGLSRRERCFCILPQHQEERLIKALQQMGIDTQTEVKRGALVCVPPEQTYLRDGTFSYTRMVDLLEASLREALALGFEGFRIMGDLGWAAACPCCSAQLPPYESIAERFFPGTAALALCMYDTRLFSPEQLRELIKLHQLALISPDPSKRVIRIRKGAAFGDVIFDPTMPSVFHYTVQQDQSPKFLATGQESSFSAALDSVRFALSQESFRKQ